MNILDKLLDELADQGWGIADGLLPPHLSQQLLHEARERWQAQLFKSANIGRSQKKHVNTDIRGDKICWIHDTDTYPASLAFLAWAQEIQHELNQAFFLGLRRFECHFARYASGAGYAKHLDQHQNTQFRKISMVLYLNPQWQAGQGGELDIYSLDSPAQAIQRVAPEMGRLVLFRSDTVPHAVLPCLTERWSVTGWFRNDANFLV